MCCVSLHAFEYHSFSYGQQVNFPLWLNITLLFQVQYLLHLSFNRSYLGCICICSGLWVRDCKTYIGGCPREKLILLLSTGLTTVLYLQVETCILSLIHVGMPTVVTMTLTLLRPSYFLNLWMHFLVLYRGTYLVAGILVLCHF